jgi:methionine-rich copper-binding protein CopC
MNYYPTNVSRAGFRTFNCPSAARVLAVLITTAIFALLDIIAAFAHAQLVHADPPAGAVVASSPNQITLNFSEKLEPAFSSVVVRNAVGKRVDNDDSYIDKYNASMRISLQPLAPGIYIVEWRALSVSTHRTEGAFVFRVGE